MPIPTYSVIDDNEIDPESPLTTSLMFRLRDNVLAVLGIDPADPAPVFTIPPSVEKAEGVGVFFAQGYGASDTTAEQIVSVIADDVEWIELGNAGYAGAIGGAGVLPHIGAHDNTPELNTGYNISLIEVLYSASVPTGVRIVAHWAAITATPSSPAITTYDVTITLANTYQNVISGIMDAKARATATEVYLQLRRDAGGLQTYIMVPFNRRSFKSKAAV